MPILQSGLSRPGSLIAVAILLAACGSGSAAQSQPAIGSGATSEVGAVASTDPGQVVGGATLELASAGATPEAAAGTCPADQVVGMQQYMVGGFQAQHFCGPATATVTLGTETVAISGGYCHDNDLGFGVSVGTQMLGSPSTDQEPDVLVILVNSVTGRGSIEGIVAHTHWILNSRPLTFGPGRLSGTFSGASVLSRVAATGTFTC